MSISGLTPFVFFKTRQKIGAVNPLSWEIYTEARSAPSRLQMLLMLKVTYFHATIPFFQVPLLIGHTGETPVYVPSSVPCLESSSLSKRAWTFQERLLSRRVLHMGKQLVHWECYECSASEVDPNGTNYGNLRDIFQTQEL